MLHDDARMSDELSLEQGKATEAPVNEAASGGKRSTLSRVIPTSRLTFQKQVEIIRAYGAAYDALKGPVGIEDITGYVKMAAATVSQTNAFLTEVGLVRKEGRRFVPAAEVQAMNRLYDVSKDKALTKLAPLFEKAWFGAWVMPKLRFRPMAEEEVVHELFEAATAEAAHLPQIRMLVDYLVLVGLVDRDGALLRVKNGCCPEGSAPTEAVGIAALATAPAEVPAAAEPPAAVLLLNADGSRRVTVKAPPTIKRHELERIKKWLEFQLIVEDEATAKEGSNVH